MRSGFIVSQVLCSLLVLGVHAQRASAVKKPDEIILDHDVTRVLKHERDFDALNAELQRWVNAPLYLRVSVAEQMLPALAKVNEVDLREYRWERGTHDLTRTAGRAALAFERLTGASLTPVTPTAGAADLVANRREATTLFLLFRGTVVATAAELCPGPPLRELREKYGGRIRPDVHGQEAIESAKLMQDLLRAWFPLGKEMKDLEELVGSRGRKDGETAAFRFDMGVHGAIFRFVIRDGVIYAVTIEGIS